MNGHGRLVAGVIAATGNNGTGVAGVSWGAEIRSFKVLGDDGMGFASDAAAGVRAAADDGARVINMSFTGDPSSTLQSAVVYAESKGAFIVAAAGNNASTTPKFPARYSGVMAVAATTSNDTLVLFSNRGTWITLAAPGVDIASTTRQQLPRGQWHLVLRTTRLGSGRPALALHLRFQRQLHSFAAHRHGSLDRCQRGRGTAAAGRRELDGAQLAGPGAPTQPGYVLDGYGGVHAASGAKVVSGYAYWAGWDIAA